ncbi:MAG: sigma-70 family RNA polymerase sigma factor [Flavobacteriales bacterium]|nr:sigma-70 family RNA polymerase sigma factor [Flavobacteriales bacterium]
MRTAQFNAETHATGDTNWVDGLRRNDQVAMRSIYKAHFPAVRQYVLQNSGTVSDAQDVFQEAIVVLWMNVKLDRFSAGTESGPGGFLFRVAKNKWLDVVRSAAHRHMKVVHNDQSLERRSDAPDDTEERITRLRGVYEKLDDKCRTILDQYYFERKDLATIAAGMGVEEDSIRTIKYRCMMKLRAFRKAISGEDIEAS